MCYAENEKQKTIALFDIILFLDINRILLAG